MLFRSIAGATNATLTVLSAATGDSGNYSVIVTGVSGSITSSVTPVAVLASPQITTDPKSESVMAGTDVNFSVIANGSDLNFQWQCNGFNLEGETKTNLFLPAVNATQAGQYSVVVANAVGRVASAPASLSVTTPPAVMDIVAAGMLTNQMFSLTVNLDPGFNYALDASTDLLQWQPVTTFGGDGGLFDFVDGDSTNYLNRYYRLRWPPTP